MAICLHPYPIGHSRRTGALDGALEYTCGHDDVLLVTGGKIIGH